MTYPTANPTMKHDLQCVNPLPPSSDTLLETMGFSNSTELFRKLEQEETPTSSTNLCSVYSYPDGPDYPGPLSRALTISGVADLSISLIRKIVNDDVPDCMHKCTIGVQLADEKRFQKLEPRHQKNSTVYCKFMRRLRKEGIAAVLSKDKHGRFAILMPMTSSTGSSGNSFDAEDCAAFCYIGEVREVMQSLAVSSNTATTSTITNTETSSDGLWQPPGQEENTTLEASETLWQPPGTTAEEEIPFSAPWQSDTGQESSSAPWEKNTNDSGAMLWDPNNNEAENNNKRGFDEINTTTEDTSNNNEFHADTGAAAADAFYSGLTRSLGTRADSRLYHMRSFNGWVKATQIAELDPKLIINGRPQTKRPLRVLDLACGKGGDLTKWSLHQRGMSTYCGIDVARGSLRDAAVRIREMRARNKLTKTKATLICADLGAEVPGRKKSPSHKHMQKLLAWSLQDESDDFKAVRGGGVEETERFDVVSIQFAIHYMMSTGQRARRFFHTVSELLEVGGNLICTTIDARVVVGHLMNLGLDLHFDDDDHLKEHAVVQAGAGACKITFEPDVVKKLVKSTASGEKLEEDLFGLQYTFTLVEGSDHSAGVGNAVNLPEWLTPIPVLESLAREAGLELEYAQNFHEFYEERKDPSAHPAAHLALYNMKVLNRDGSISADEWSVSRLYAAIRFRKVRESSIIMDHEVEEKEDESDEEEQFPPLKRQKEATKPQPQNGGAAAVDPIKAKKFLPLAMMKAKKAAGEDTWRTFSSDEKKRLTQIELVKLASK